MARLPNTLLEGRSYARFTQAPITDLSMGGMFGWAPDLREINSNSQYVRRNLVPILLEAPGFFRYMQEPDVWTRSLRSIVELHSKSIEGLNAGLTVETTSVPVGGGGEEQDEAMDVKRTRSTPTHVYNEKYGRGIQVFHENWITYGIMDPESKFANIGTLAGDRPTDMLLDMYCMTMLYFEPDPTHRKVMKAWVVAGMFPKSAGDNIGKRDITAGMEMQEHSIEYTGVAQYGLGPRLLAQRILDNITITNANPNARDAFISGISQDVVAQAKGYAAQTQYFSDTSILRP